MPHNPYYMSRHWRGLRALALFRDGYRCVTPGCRNPATVVDHIVSRGPSPLPTAADRLDNLRSLCRGCDVRVRELPGSRRRRRGGQPTVRGVGVDGWPKRPH